jgi:hypothetical protein
MIEYWRTKLIISAVLIAILVYTMIVIELPTGKTYDCSLAEFHPDYPVRVKEACRDLRKQNAR